MQSEASHSSKVPTVDLGEVGVHHTEEPSQQEWERVMRELDQAFSDIGCAYLTGHGVPHDLINEVLRSGIAFFKLDEDAKIRWSEDKGICGYSKFDSARYANAGPELHESFIVRLESYSPPNNEAPSFMTPLVPLHKLVQALSQKLLKVFALSLNRNRDYLMNMHLDSGTKKSICIYCMNYYPVGAGNRQDVVGFGAHVDSTCLTFLFSNDTEGFQIRDSAGQWVDVPLFPGTILLMAGEFLHYHSDKRFMMPVHRVVLPREYEPGRQPRCSLGYFLYPDEHVPLRPFNDKLPSHTLPSAKDIQEGKVHVARAAASRY